MKILIIILLVFGFLGLAAVGGFGYWIGSNNRPVLTNTTSSQVNPEVFVVAKGQSIESIGSKLEAAGLIRSSLAFKLTVYRLGLTQKIQAGTFRLSPTMSTTEVAQALTEGKSLDFWVTLLEGWRREEMATELEAAFTEAGLEFDPKTFLSLTEKYEGKLFPDTYLIPVTADEAFVVSLLTNTYEAKTSDLDFSTAPLGLTPAEVLTLAAIVEREARQHESRRMVAGILLNRLEIGMPLQVDASLQYIKGNAREWWPTPWAADKELVSPYNTYTHAGLPPGPIANPSLSSIQAVLEPASSDYLYYITGNDNKMHYGKTLEEHNQNIRLYL